MSPATPSADPGDPADSADSGPQPPPAGAAPLWSRAFVDLIVAQAFFGFSYSVFLLLPKLLAIGYGASARDIGLIMAAFGVASLAAIPGVSPVARRLGYRRTMALASLLLGASALAFIFIGRAGPAAALLRGVHGIAWSLFFASGMSLLADIAPPARLGQAIGLYGGASLAMNAVAPAFAEPLAARFGARPVFLLAAAIAFIGAWRCRRLPTGAAAGTGNAVAAGDSGRQRVIALGPVFVVLAVGGLAAAGMFTFVAPFALTHGIGVVRGFFIAYTATALGVRVAGARVTDRAGYRRTALAGAAGYGLVVIATGLLGPSHLVLLGGAFGVAHGIVFPALMALILGGAGPGDRPRLLAFANGAINLGIVGVGLLGAAANHLGYGPVFVATGVITFAAALLLVPTPARASASSI